MHTRDGDDQAHPAAGGLNLQGPSCTCEALEQRRHHRVGRRPAYRRATCDLRWVPVAHSPQPKPAPARPALKRPTGIGACQAALCAISGRLCSCLCQGRLAAAVEAAAAAVGGEAGAGQTPWAAPADSAGACATVAHTRSTVPACRAAPRLHLIAPHLVQLGREEVGVLARARRAEALAVEQTAPVVAAHDRSASRAVAAEHQGGAPGRVGVRDHEHRLHEAAARGARPQGSARPD